MEDLITREEAAKILCKPVSWLRYAERKKLIPFVRVGTQIRYRVEDLEAWLVENSVRPRGAK